MTSAERDMLRLALVAVENGAHNIIWRMDMGVPVDDFDQTLMEGVLEAAKIAQTHLRDIVATSRQSHDCPR